MTRQPLQSAAPYGEDPAEPLYEETPHSSVFKQMESVGESVTLLPITRAAKRGEVPVQPAPEETKIKTSRKRKQQEEAPAQQETKSVQQEAKSAQQEAAPIQDLVPPSEQAAPVEKRESAEEEDHAEAPFFKCEKDLEGWHLNTWLREQSSHANKEIVKIKEYMQKAVLLGKQTKFCYTADGLLARKKEEEGYRDRIVVPETLKAFVLGQHHNLPLHAHQGRERMLKMIASRYYWPKMAEDVKRWTNSCESCVKRKTPRKMNVGLTTDALATQPWAVRYRPGRRVHRNNVGQQMDFNNNRPFHEVAHSCGHPGQESDDSGESALRALDM
jgi:hypothetical protein